jgi:predicted acetyltransferase
MIVRNPTAGEVERAIEVAAIAFPNLTHGQWTESFGMIAEVFGTRFILVVEDEGVIVSTLVCQPMPVYINGGAVSHASTGAVATIPESRCKGCAGAMLAQCVRLLREEGVYLSSLWPFSYPYYRKFGWEIGAESRSYSAPGNVLAQLGDASKARNGIKADLPEVKHVYDEWARGFNCLTQRSDVWWERVIPIRLLAEPNLVVHETAGRIDGYAAFKMGEDDEKRSVDVGEIAYARAEHRRDMLALLGSTNPEATVSFGAPATDLYLQEIANPRLIGASICPSFQFRVTDPPRAMQSLAVDEKVSGRVSFAISDPVVQEGWEFGVEVEAGAVSLARPDSKCAIETDVRTFARLYSGYLTALDAWELGKLKAAGNATETLLAACEIFSPLTPYRTWLEPG